MSLFFVTGMPRARTAWVANYLTFGPCFCEHEALSQVPTPEQLVARMRSFESIGASGISDSGAVRFHRQLRAIVPDAKWVFLRRDPEESEDSFWQEQDIAVSLAGHARAVESAIRPGDLVVDFGDIDARILEIARFVCPDWAHLQVRHDMLLGWDVQLTRGAMAAGTSRVARSGILDHFDPS